MSSNGLTNRWQARMDTAFSTVEPLWRPSDERIKNSNLARFQRWLSTECELDLAGAAALYDWSIQETENFWSAIVQFFGVQFRHPADSVLRRGHGPLETRWFPGA